MNYSPEEFEALHAEIERQGGALLPDLCEQQTIVYEKPLYKRNKTEKRATCGCGNLTMFVSEYPFSKNKSHFVTSCAVCDSMGDWPRYREVVVNAPERGTE
jgi:hypothetical protein